LRTYAGFVDRGMLGRTVLPMRAKASSTTRRMRRCGCSSAARASRGQTDPDLLRDLFPTLAAIVHAHVEGTRYGIKVDPVDGLLRPATRHSAHLDGCEARRPRLHAADRQAVEINALWLNALEVGARLAGRVRNSAEKRFCQDLLKRAGAGFSRFWNEDAACLYDVIDVDGGSAHDAGIRPNQIFAGLAALLRAAAGTGCAPWWTPAPVNY